MSVGARPVRGWRVLGLALGFVCAALCGCRSRPLPEHGSRAERLYVARCGGKCHEAHDPRSMTAAMWQVQMKRMEAVAAQAGMPLSPQEKRTVLNYLERNAGHQ